MARTQIPVQTITKNTAAAAAFMDADGSNGMYFVNDGKTELLVQNGGGSSCTVTVHSVADPYGRTGDLTPAVAAGALLSVPEMDAILFNQQLGGASVVEIDFSEATSVTVAAIQRA